MYKDLTWSILAVWEYFEGWSCQVWGAS